MRLLMLVFVFILDYQGHSYDVRIAMLLPLHGIKNEMKTHENPREGKK